MLPFSPLHHLYSPQLMRMAFETVIKCLCSTLPLHYSWIPIDHIYTYTMGITVISWIPKTNSWAYWDKKLTSWPVAKEKFTACDAKLDDFKEPLIGKKLSCMKLLWSFECAAANVWAIIQYYHLLSFSRAILL